MNKNIKDLSELEIYQKMRNNKAWDSEYFRLEAELEDRKNLENGKEEYY